MEGPEFIIVIVAIVCASGLIKTWINRNHSRFDEESLSRLAQAFMNHKKEMQRRVRNLEAIIAEEDVEDHFPQIEKSESEASLTNDLQHKDKVRS